MNEACSNFRDLLIDSADGELVGDERARVAEHLLHCAACRDELRQLELSLNLVRAEWRRATLPVPNRARPLRWSGIAARTAACIACLLVAAAVFLPGAKHSTPPQIAIHNEPVAEKPMSDAEINDYISREARAARLAVSANLLASQPGLESYAAGAEHYLEKVNPGN